jgi:hypothetical protein
VDETAVGHSVLPGRCVDTRDPQPPEIAPALPSIPVGIPLGFHPGFVGPTEKMMPRSPIPLRIAKNLLVATTPISSTLYSHCYIAPLKTNNSPKNESAFFGGSSSDPASTVTV